MRSYSRQTLEERFWPKVDKRSPTECWDWKGARTGLPNATHKYGYLGRTPASSLGPLVPAIMAHRASWQIHNKRAIPDGMDVCHSCDRPICVNPNHLFLGTQSDNNRDRSRKGRDGARYAENQRLGTRKASRPGRLNANAKLTPDQVREIRDKYAGGGVTQDALSAEYGVSQAHASRLVRGLVYTDLS